MMTSAQRLAALPAFLSLCFAGCATSPKPQAATAPVRPIFEQASAPLAQPPVIPAVYKRYYVGLVSDGPTGRFARPPGEFIVRESDERWNSAGGASSSDRGPSLGYQSSAFHPDPLPGEVQAAMAQASASMERLGEENARLRREVEAANKAALAAASRPPEAPAVPPPTTAPTAVAATTPTAASAEPAKNGSNLTSTAAAPSLLTFNPSPENTIEVTSEFASHAVGTPRIPFEQVYFPTPVMTEAKFLLTVVVPGPDATAVINRKIYAPGDQVSDGFTLQEIDEDGVWLRRTFFRVRIPFQSQPITVRFPQDS
jgi:hypothetical protein